MFILENTAEPAGLTGGRRRLPKDKATILKPGGPIREQ
jgi:hypothetical protein